eukprot:1161959-Pelagomonas_calceolata.AAC.6
MHRTSLMGRDISVTRAIPKDQMPPRSDPDRRMSSSRAGGPGSRDFGGYNSYGRLSGGYMPPAGPMAPMRRGGLEPPPMRGGAGGRGGFRVYISGLPAHFTWRWVGGEGTEEVVRACFEVA